MVQILSARLATVFLLNEAGTAVVSQACYPPNEYPVGIAYALGEGITGWVAQTGEMYVSKQFLEDPVRLSKNEDPRYSRTHSQHRPAAC